MANSTERAWAAFAEVFTGRNPAAVALAPGRVNLIGEHTDYNDGFVLPMAIDANVAVAFAGRNDEMVRAYSTDYAETREAAIQELNPPGGNAWFDYVAAVVWALREAGEDVSGIDLAIAGDVPVGAGLSSSAALEMVVARAICFASSLDWNPVRMAIVCQRAENEYVGVNCGIMDQFAASVSVEGSALLLDCRTLEYSPVRIPGNVRVVVMDTGVRRSLAASEYNERRESCERAVEVIRQSHSDVRALRDVDPRLLSSVSSMLDETVMRRAQHVIAEIGRPVQVAEALGAEDLDSVGRLMNESHVSLRDLYEVSCRELDTVTEIARSHHACYGARMTGAGFGGCAVALVSRDREEEFVLDVAEKYSSATGLRGAMYVCRPSPGATVVETPSDNV